MKTVSMDGVRTYLFHLCQITLHNMLSMIKWKTSVWFGQSASLRCNSLPKSPVVFVRRRGKACWLGNMNCGLCRLFEAHSAYTQALHSFCFHCVWFVFSGGQWGVKTKIELFFSISPLCATVNLSLESTEFEARHTRTACGVLGRSLRAYSTSITNYVSTPQILGIPSKQNVLFCTGRSSFSPCSYSCVWWLLCWQDKLTN